ncbi:MAG: CapA family protein [Polyangiaceae bacterium]
MTSAVVIAACTVGDGGILLPTRASAAIQAWNDQTTSALAASPSSRSIRVLVGGDLLPHRPMLSEPSQIASALAPLHSLFESADAVVANYETATGTVSAAEDRRLVYGVEPGWMDAIAGSGVTAVTLANNHACDLGRAGLEASIEAAKGSMVGLGAANADPWRASTIAEKNGHRVCAVAWTTFLNDAGSSCEKSGEIAVAPLGRKGTERATRAIAAARASGCDATIAIFHGGLEYEPQVAVVRAQARAAAEAGADAVVIHHPHVPSPLRIFVASDGRRVPIFESIGNLVSNQGESWTASYPATQIDRHLVYLNGTTRVGLLADLSFDFPVRGVGTRPEVHWGYHVIWDDNDHAANRANPTPHIEARLLDAVDDARVVAKLTHDRALGELLRSPCWLDTSLPDPRTGSTNCL